MLYKNTKTTFILYSVELKNIQGGRGVGVLGFTFFGSTAGVKEDQPEDLGNSATRVVGALLGAGFSMWTGA
uniref:Uncharacterized protein n=1 Tax=Enterococcus faecium TaxID=1352 RepID=A0A0H5B196_ENTFC|nr:hypothetical protein [Enterococcus faecium]